MMKNSLNIEIWKYLILFSILTLAFLWTFQVLFLNHYYQFVKKKEMKKVALQIEKANSISELKEVINESAYNQNICVELTDAYRSIYTSEYLSLGCLTNSTKNNYKKNFIYSNAKSNTYQVTNSNLKNKTLVYALKLNNNFYAFLNTSLEPIDSTVGILKNQLIYVTIIVLILSFVIAYFISRHIANPIVKINKAANKLAKHDFNVNFESNSQIEEINELAETLNHTKNELEKTEELRKDLMANVSHDLKTPLTMIKAYAEMSRDLNGDIVEKRYKNMNIIIEEVDRLSSLVDDILTLSSMQSEINDLNLSRFDLVELISNILKRYEIYKELENYQFVFSNKKKIMITADQKKIEQVIYNLVNNAINYTGSDKLVTIKIKQTKEVIRVEVIDTGDGISKEDLPFIWDRYYKNKKKHKRNLVGTGLGLSIVKSILELHHYKYGVISTKGKTTFYFEIEKEA